MLELAAEPGPRTGCGGAPVKRRREESERLLCVGAGGLRSPRGSGPASRSGWATGDGRLANEPSPAGERGLRNAVG